MVSAGELILMEPKVLHHRKKQTIGSATFSFQAIFSKDFFCFGLYTQWKEVVRVFTIMLQKLFCT